MDKLKKAFFDGFREAIDMYHSLGWDDVYLDEAEEQWGQWIKNNSDQKENNGTKKV